MQESNASDSTSYCWIRCIMSASGLHMLLCSKGCHAFLQSCDGCDRAESAEGRPVTWVVSQTCKWRLTLYRIFQKHHRSSHATTQSNTYIIAEFLLASLDVLLHIWSPLSLGSSLTYTLEMLVGFILHLYVETCAAQVSVRTLCANPLGWPIPYNKHNTAWPITKLKVTSKRCGVVETRYRRQFRIRTRLTVPQILNFSWFLLSPLTRFVWRVTQDHSHAQEDHKGRGCLATSTDTQMCAIWFAYLFQHSFSTEVNLGRQDCLISITLL